jgi:hypothetical protein
VPAMPIACEDLASALAPRLVAAAHRPSGRLVYRVLMSRRAVGRISKPLRLKSACDYRNKSLLLGDATCRGWVA